MRKKRLIALILAIVMIIALPIGVYFYPSLFNNDNGDGGNGNGGGSGGGNKPAPITQLTSQVVAYVVNQVCDANYKIIDGYAAGSSVDNAAAGKETDGGIENYSETPVIPEYLNNYFNSLGMCLTVPAVLDYVMNSADSDVYSNRFTLGQTYMCREVIGEKEYED